MNRRGRRSVERKEKRKRGKEEEEINQFSLSESHRNTSAMKMSLKWGMPTNSWFNNHSHHIDVMVTEAAESFGRRGGGKARGQRRRRRATGFAVRPPPSARHAMREGGGWRRRHERKSASVVCETSE